MDHGSLGLSVQDSLLLFAVDWEQEQEEVEEDDDESYVRKWKLRPLSVFVWREVVDDLYVLIFFFLYNLGFDFSVLFLILNVLVVHVHKCYIYIYSQELIRNFIAIPNCMKIFPLFAYTTMNS